MQLGELQSIESEISAAGFQIVALSPESPSVLQPFLEAKDYAYRLLSDARLEAASGFGIAYRLDDDTAGQYRSFGVDLDARSGEDHQGLPVPAVFVTNAEGTVTFTYVNPDYRIRLDPRVLLAAVHAAAGGK